jgi:phosphatidylglycerol:prolipoprotein diacylglycerol transferase
VKVNLYGIFIALGIAAGLVYMNREARRLPLPEDVGLDIALWAVPPAVVFARLYYVVFTWERYRANPLNALYIWEGGLAIYGGVIGGALGVFLLARHRKISFFTLADLIAPGLILGQAIGRWGNFFNGEAYGYEVLNPFFQSFPFAVLVSGKWYLAAFFYESVWNLLGFLFLLTMKGRCQEKGKGYVLLWYLIWYGLGRMVIEGLRTDSLLIGGARVSQLLSMMALAVAGTIIILKGKYSRLLLLPLLPAAGLFALSALGFVWALLPGYILMAAFAGLILYAFRQPRPAKELQ